MNSTQTWGLTATILTSVLLDLHGWSNSSLKAGKWLPFDWRLAVARWVTGALVGTAYASTTGGS